MGDDLAHPTAEGNPRDPAPGNLCRFLPHVRKRSAQGRCDPDLDLSQRVGGACRSLCFLHRLGKVVIGAAQDQRCHTDLISLLENLCGFEARLPACRLQIGRGLPNIQPPVDLSCCQQSWAVPAPVDLWALICGQKDACSASREEAGEKRK